MTSDTRDRKILPVRAKCMNRPSETRAEAGLVDAGLVDAGLVDVLRDIKAHVISIVTIKVGRSR